jgi:chromosome segregation ATPase
MYMNKLTGISIIALGAISSLVAEPGVVSVAQDPEILIQKITEQKNAVKNSEAEFKQLVERLIQKGQLVSIDALVDNKTPEYLQDWEKIKALHAAYETSQSSFAAGKDEPEAVKVLRAELAAKQESANKLEEDDNSASLDATPNSEQLKQKITVLESANENLYNTLAEYTKMDRATQGAIKGLQSKVKSAKGAAADRYAGLIKDKEDLIAANAAKIKTAQEAIKKNETEIANLKAESEGGSAISARAQGLKDKRVAKSAIQKEIKLIKANLKAALEQHSTGRVNKKALKSALSEVVVAYTQFVQKFIGSGQGAQNCLEKCTELLLQKTEDSLSKPAGTCSVGGVAPGLADPVPPVEVDDAVRSDDNASANNGSSAADAAQAEKIQAFSDKILDALAQVNKLENRTPEMQRKLEALNAKFQEMRNLADAISDNGASGPYVKDRKNLLARGMQLSNMLAEFSVVEEPAVVAQSSLGAAGADKPVLAIEGPKVAALDNDQKALIGRIGSVMNAGKNMKNAHKNKLLGAIDFSNNCSKIQELQKDSRLNDKQKSDLRAFLAQYQDRCIN